MQKKIVLAVDDTRPSRNAVNYVAGLAPFIDHLHVMLFHVQPMISQFLQDEARVKAEARRKMEKVLKTNRKKAREILESHRALLEKSGIQSDHIQELSRPRHLGYAKDIIEHVQKGMFDAVVVGRRGISGIQKMYTGSVTTDIVEQSQFIPVWMVDGEVRADGNILLAVDGSEASLRAVDHAAFILSGESTARLTLMHVEGGTRNYCEVDFDADPDPELEALVKQGSQTCIDQFHAHAVNHLDSAGIDRSRIRFETVKDGRRVGRVIRDFAVKNGFSTVVVGRRGIEQSFFMGSASRYMIDKCSNGAVWLVP